MLKEGGGGSRLGPKGGWRTDSGAPPLQIFEQEMTLGKSHWGFSMKAIGTSKDQFKVHHLNTGQD